MHYKEYRTLLSAQNGMNLYRGCSHGCIYCDSRSKCYRMEHDFEDIEIKKDAPAMLERELLKKRKKGMIFTGAMSDPYLPLEKTLCYTRGCLEVIARHGFGLAILTKSDLILRDLDLLEKIRDNAKCVVQMTLTTYDERLCAVVEPNVASTARRFEVLQIMKERGIPTVVWLCPFLPFLNDTEENLRGLLDYCVRAGVWGILNFGIGLTLREGDREYFYAALDRHFPGLKQQYHQKYGYRYSLISDNHDALMSIFHRECQKHGIRTDAGEIFSFMHSLPDRQEQLSFSFPS